MVVLVVVLVVVSVVEGGGSEGEEGVIGDDGASGEEEGGGPMWRISSIGDPFFVWVIGSMSDGGGSSIVEGSWAGWGGGGGGGSWIGPLVWVSAGVEGLIVLW